MDTFYDGDLKDIWDSDLDPTESLKISNENDMHDWFLERDIKDRTVILNDKLISDALLNGTVPIKSEHSYSLNGDGDSLPTSPRLHTKIDDMDDECYPAISLKTATSNIRPPHTATIDPKCLIISTSTSSYSPSSIVTSLKSNNITTYTSVMTAPISASVKQTMASSKLNNGYSERNKIESSQLSINIQPLDNYNNLSNSEMSESAKYSTLHAQHNFRSQFNSPKQFCAEFQNECSSSTCDGSISPNLCSDIEIDETCIKDEPMSPDSSCPPSPNDLHNFNSNSESSVSLSIVNMAALTKSDLVFEHKNGCLQLTPASQSLLKSQQLVMGTSTNTNHNIIISKRCVKSEAKIQNVETQKSKSPSRHSNVNFYGLPLTPPSSLSSDDSEGNLTPEHLLSPLSPNTSISISMATSTATTVGAMRRSANNANWSLTSTNCLNSMRNSNANGTTRQPIHTPLISSQPKGSTGTLILTEEEKRTLLAEGYPIPQKLPLTKAEEKSLKKIRRKIKNKISAQESRRKKKEYMDQLERRVEVLVNENNDYRKRVESLEDSNANLLNQLNKLQALVNKQHVKKN